ncbi:hypothetical protein F5877DRAFT_71805 [Lentinula edodes]|nr:hypothetical protein F5877DRAFT_71805 [Lentinula edodes]
MWRRRVKVGGGSYGRQVCHLEIINAGADVLLGFINDTKTMLLDLSTDLKIGNEDVGLYLKDLVLESVDYGKPTNVGNKLDGLLIASEANIQPLPPISPPPHFPLPSISNPHHDANVNGTKYFFFEYFHDTLKTEVYGH